MCTDACTETSGWGADIGELTTRGIFLPSDLTFTFGYINTLERLAIKFELLSFKELLRDKHVLVKCDNTTAVAYIRNMGGTHSVVCNQIAKDIWTWCQSMHIWLSCTHIPGISNSVANEESRKQNVRTEWKLASLIFVELCNILGQPNIDAFASRSNSQLLRYCSWCPDPGAEHVDAFTVSWENDFMYCLPHFSLLGGVLQKLALNKSDAILILPRWPTQVWFSAAMAMLTHLPMLLPRTPDLLTLPHAPHLCHPLYPNMELMACRVSGRPSCVTDFLLGQPQLSCHPGAGLHKHSILHTLRDGKCFATNGRLIQPIRL